MSSSPTGAMPAIGGGAVSVSARGATTAVAALTALLEPPALPAVSVTRSVWPTSLAAMA